MGKAGRIALSFGNHYLSRWWEASSEPESLGTAKKYLEQALELLRRGKNRGLAQERLGEVNQLLRAIKAGSAVNPATVFM